MNKQDLIRMLNIKRVSPFDGMPVTATIWEDAHIYHRRQQQLHALFSHGPGVVTGLEVIASDPPDNSVYILPGIAVDPLGQVIALTEPTVYHIEEAEDLFYLLLTYGESRPRASDDHDSEDGPLYVHAEFGIELGRPGPRDHAAVELARIRRQDKAAPIVDPQDTEHPGPNQIDMRFRRQVGAASKDVVALAVSYVGGDKTPDHGHGASHLARALRRSGDLLVWTDRHVPLTADLGLYTLVYLVGQGAFTLSPEEMQVLYDYVQGGGTLLIESCRREFDGDDPPSDAAFADMLASLGFKLEDLALDHRLLAEPFLFAAPPPGFETQGGPGVRLGKGVIFSTYDYGCSWQGARRDGSASREQIRSAHEWGANIIAYAVDRQQRMKGLED